MKLNLVIEERKRRGNYGQLLRSSSTCVSPLSGWCGAVACGKDEVQARGESKEN